MKKESFNKVNICLGVCLIILQLHDMYMTLTIINAGGSEANPIIRYTMEHFGVVGGLVFVKCIAISIIATLSMCKENTHLIRYLMILLLIIYIFILGQTTIIYWELLCPG